MKLAQFTVLAVCLCAASAGWIPEKLVKKYAMDKVYDDCFGDEVMSSLKAEMRAAYIKCSGHNTQDLPAADAIIREEQDDTLLRRKRKAQVIIIINKRNARHFSPGKLQKLRTKISSFVSNATCVMRELKFLDQENNVDLDSMKERVTNMQVDDGLKKDMVKIMDGCYQLSSCMPDSVVNRPVAAMGFGRQMVFFKCLEEGKLEACMKKTFREDYLPMLVEENLPVDEDDSFYTKIMAAIIGEQSHSH